MPSICYANTAKLGRTAEDASPYGLACHPERRAITRSRSFAVGAQAEQAKPRNDSDEGIFEGYTIALVQKVTFATKANKTPNEIPLAVLAFLFCYSAKQKFDCVWFIAFLLYFFVTSPHSAQDDTLNKVRRVMV